MLATNVHVYVQLASLTNVFAPRTDTSKMNVMSLSILILFTPKLVLFRVGVAETNCCFLGLNLSWYKDIKSQRLLLLLHFSINDIILSMEVKLYF